MLEPAIDLIKVFEGFSATPYICPAGIPTIGYGSTRYKSGKPVTLKDPPISKMDAADIVFHDVELCKMKVLQLVKAPITDNQLCALISFVYNLGSGRLQASTLLRKLNRKDYVGAAQEFPKWCFAGKKKLRGLQLRREAERQLFL